MRGSLCARARTPWGAAAVGRMLEGAARRERAQAAGILLWDNGDRWQARGEAEAVAQLGRWSCEILPDEVADMRTVTELLVKAHVLRIVAEARTRPRATMMHRRRAHRNAKRR